MRSNSQRNSPAQRTDADELASAGITIVADDFGMSEAVSLGILDALEAGRITGASVMTSRPGWRLHAPELLAGARCEIGLHLNLTFDRPLSKAGELTACAELPTPARLFVALMRGEIGRNALHEEIARQLEAFEQAMGRAPDFIDGHQHVHAFPVVRDVLIDFVLRRQLEQRIWLRDSSDALRRILQRRSALTHATALAAVARRGGALARNAGIATNDGFSGVSSLSRLRDLDLEFARFLVAPGGRHLLMVHPGRDEEDPRHSDGLGPRRAAELRLLLSPAWPGMLSRAGLTPRRFPLRVSAK